MASIPDGQRELNFIINVLVPEQRENGTLAIHCRKVAAHEDKAVSPAKPQRKKRNHCRKGRKPILPGMTEWVGFLLAVFASVICYIALAAAEVTRRGYFSLGGEVVFALAVGYIVFRVAGTKNAPAT